MAIQALSRQEVREIDRRAIEELGMPGVVLMENAGRGVAALLLELGVTGPVIICVGKGNNGGDGLVIARHLDNCEINVRVLLFCDPDELKGDAEINYHILAAAKSPPVVIQTEPTAAQIMNEFSNAQWIVDALLGTGMKGTVREPHASIIGWINTAGKRVLSVDLPSGMDCDSGESPGCCIQADHTATFVARKLGFENPESKQLTGQVHVVDIGVPRRWISRRF